MSQVKISDLTIKASVLVKDAVKPQRGITKVSTIFISAGSLQIGSATVGGEFTDSQALTEFKRNPKRFTPGKDFAAAQAVGLV